MMLDFFVEDFLSDEAAEAYRRDGAANEGRRRVELHNLRVLVELKGNGVQRLKVLEVLWVEGKFITGERESKAVSQF